MINENKVDTKTNVESFNFKKAFQTYSKQWKWFLACLFIALALAFIYIRYTVPEYTASAKIMLIDESDGTTPGAVFKDLSMFSGSEASELEDEIQIVRSRKLINKVVDNLDLNIQYFVQGRIYETEVYKNLPIKLNFIAGDSLINKANFEFYVEILSKLKFNYKINEEDEPQQKSFGESITTDVGGMIITPVDGDFEDLIGETIRVRLSPVTRVALNYRDKFDVYPIENSTKIIGISLDDPVRAKAKDVINESIKQYIQLSLEDKIKKSENTAEFINERINLIATDLSDVDDNAERFKTGNKLTNISSEAEIYLNTSSQMEQELASNMTELNVINFMKGEVEGEAGEYKPIPLNVGVTDPSISATAAKYNELVNTRAARLKSSSEKNPIIVNLDQEINNLRKSLSQSLNNSSKTIAIKVRNLQNQAEKLNSKIYAVPGQARELRDIEREQGTKEALYLYLLQKREEAAISLAATSPRATVIEEAYSFGGPISPNKRLVYVISVFLGLFVPFSVIYLKDLFDTKIHNKEDLERLISNITVLGEIPKLKAKEAEDFVKRNDRSLLSESFRIIRTNFDFVRRGRATKDYDNVVFVTSTINGEGKSFFSINMALTLANTDKRVLLIGGDIRNPQTHTILKNQKSNMVSEIGLTEYLTDESILIGEAINTYEVNNIKLDVLFSGKIPPNPAELLMSDRIKPMFDKVSEQYDYVIVDTAPSMLVTDTLLFSEYAGHTIYLTRADYTEKNILNFASELHADKKLNGMMLVVNDVKQSNFGYGAKYGYYGAPKKKGFFSKKS